MHAVRSVHERVLEAPAAAAGGLLDRLSSDDDPVFPTPAWPAMRFDRPLGVGADGGHGAVRYAVGAYEPGRRVRFDFTAPDEGFHELEIEPLDSGRRCRLRHTLEAPMGPVDRLMWALAIRWAHDTVVEEVFDNFERAATGSVAGRPVRRSRWVGLLRRAEDEKTAAVELPENAVLARTAFAAPDFADACRLALRPGMPRDPQAWRSVLPFPVVARGERELLLGRDAGHLDFRASLLVGDEHLTLSTVVRIHNLRGRVYWAVVRPGHPFMTRTMLRRYWRRLALAAPSAGEREWERKGAGAAAK